MEITARQKTLLKKIPLDASDPGYQGAITEVPEGKKYPILRYEDAENGHYMVVLDHGAGVWFVYGPHWLLPWQETGAGEKEEPTVFFTPTILQQICPGLALAKAEEFALPLNVACKEFDITTSARAAAFIAQLVHECGCFRYSEEIASGEAYEGRKDLGNDAPGDGKQYKGRGLIQLTGKANYIAAGKALGVNLVGDPNLAAKDPLLMARIAGWFWQTRNLNELADKGDFEAITRRINGGYNGLEDRKNKWERAKAALLPEVHVGPGQCAKVDWSNPASQVSQFFTVREVTLGDRRRIPVDIKVQSRICSLARELDKIRIAHGSPIGVSSWYRPPAINAAVGGVKNSQHITGLAADIYPIGQDIFAFQSWLDNHWYGALGYGAKKGFVHVDIRNHKGFDTGGVKGVRWSY